MTFTNTLDFIATIIHLLINIYIWVIIATVLISWLNLDPSNRIIVILRNLTEPLFAKIRNKIPLVYANVDFTPLFVLIILQVIDMVVVKSLTNSISKFFQ